MLLFHGTMSLHGKCIILHVMCNTGSTWHVHNK